MWSVLARLWLCDNRREGLRTTLTARLCHVAKPESACRCVWTSALALPVAPQSPAARAVGRHCLDCALASRCCFSSVTRCSLRRDRQRTHTTTMQPPSCLTTSPWSAISSFPSPEVSRVTSTSCRKSSSTVATRSSSSPISTRVALASAT